MDDQFLLEISTSLTRIEGKLDASAVRFDQHVRDDALIAHDVRMLARQRGYFLSGCITVGAGITAAAAYVVKRLIGSH
jgi:hypothetical protein